MEFINDIREIKIQSALKREENLDFIEYLKNLSNDKSIESILNNAADKAFSGIKCIECGNCCRENIPLLDEQDVLRVSKHLGLKSDDFIIGHLHKYEKYNIYIMNEVPCPFLEGNECSIYDQRFHSCKAYPEIRSLEHIISKGNILINAAICPIIFNFYEFLKYDLNFKK